MVEVCANGVESCLAAQEGGADRVELCAGIPEGGTTPSYGEIQVARRVLTSTRLHVIIRPRGGDFLYSDLEVERMAADIAVCRELGVDGVVFGCLKADGTLDMDKNRYLMQCSHGMSVTLHRAFDRAADPVQALEDAIALGFDRGGPHHPDGGQRRDRGEYPRHPRCYRADRVSFLGPGAASQCDAVCQPEPVYGSSRSQRSRPRLHHVAPCRCHHRAASLLSAVSLIEGFSLFFSQKYALQ